VATSWFVFFGYHNDARSDKHQIVKGLFDPVPEGAMTSKRRSIPIDTM